MTTHHEYEVTPKPASSRRQMDVAIERLSRTIAGPGATDAARIRLAVTYVSDIPDWDLEHA